MRFYLTNNWKYCRAKEYIKVQFFSFDIDLQAKAIGITVFNFDFEIIY
jgi:hypothetical protein